MQINITAIINQMKEVVKKYWLVLVIFGVVMMAIISLIISGKESKDGEIQPETTKTPIVSTPTPPPAARVGFGPELTKSEELIKTQTEELDQNKRDYPLASELPYTTELFTVDHYREARKLVVIIKSGTSKEVVTQKIYKWLIENGFEENSHEIIWTEQ